MGRLVLGVVLGLAGITQCNIEVPPIDPDDYVVIHVYGPDGEPLGDVRFRFIHRSGNGSSSSSGMSAMHGEGGAYYFAIPDGSRKAYYSATEGDDVFTLAVHHEEHGDASASLARGQSEVEFRFAVAAQLEVTVAGYVGSSVQGRVDVVATPAGEPSRHYGYSNDAIGLDGVKRFDALAPGDYVLRLVLRSDTGRRSFSTGTIGTLQVVLGAGANTARMAIPPLYPLDVIVPGGREGASVQVSRREGNEPIPWGSSWHAKCDAQGRAHFDEVPAGSYRLNIWGGEQKGQMRIEVPAGDVVFRPDPE